ncbi:LOB domain-containing protein 36 [Medicago truncatula]|uniref:LOB domain protein n=2 Tax=Medicago truncatula TaxID=3880 RepID=G7LGC9_MEDTR|nr:LOB domain-containing protein 36 [Medicago truncatula]AET04053.1 LOB domain protein [Medicago truncatula]
MAREIIRPCAACKHLRQECDSSCDLAPYFPPDNPERFIKVHSVFGKNNVSNMLKKVDASHHEQAIESFVYEAEARLRDPVYGCAGPAKDLQRRLNEVQMELKSVKNELAKYLNPQIVEFVLGFPDCFGFKPNASAPTMTIGAGQLAFNQLPAAELTTQQIHNLEVLKQNLLSGPDGDDGLAGFHMDVNVPVENGGINTSSHPVGGGSVNGSGGSTRFQMGADILVRDSGLAGSHMLPDVPPADAPSALPSSRADTIDNGGTSNQ